MKHRGNAREPSTRPPADAGGFFRDDRPVGEQRRRRQALERRVGRAVDRLRGAGHDVEDVDVQGDVVDVRLVGAAPRVAAERTLEIKCPACGGRLQVLVSREGPSDWRHEDPGCPAWLAAATEPATLHATDFRRQVAALVRPMLTH